MVHGCQVLMEVKYNQKSLLPTWGHNVDARSNTEWKRDYIFSLPSLSPGFTAVIHCRVL